MTPKFTAAPNPDYPGKGQRPFCIIRTDPDGTSGKLPRQFNVEHTASREAYRIQARIDWEARRTVYVGD